MSNDDAMWDDTPGDEVEVVVIDTPERNPDDEVAVLVQQNPEGGEIVSEVNFSEPALDENGAKEITNRIRNTANVMFMLMKRAHAGKAHKALGYSSFEAYVKAEFDYSKVYAYRLINQANFIQAIEEKLPEGAEIHISEPVTTKLKSVLPELLEELEERKVHDMSIDDAGDLIEEIIADRQANNFLNGGDEEPEGDDGYDDNYQGGGGGGGPYPDGDEPDEDIDFIDSEYDDEEMESSSEIRRKFDKIYHLYSGLRSIHTVGNGEELIPFLPEERYDEFVGLLKDTVPWLTDFQERLNQHISENGTVSEEDEDADDEVDGLEPDEDDE